MGLRLYSPSSGRPVLFSRMLFAWSSSTGCNFKSSAPSSQRLASREVIRIDPCSAVGKYSLILKASGASDGTPYSRSKLSKTNSHWSLDRRDNQSRTPSIISSTFELSFCRYCRLFSES